MAVQPSTSVMWRYQGGLPQQEPPKDAYSRARASSGSPGTAATVTDGPEVCPGRDGRRAGQWPCVKPTGTASTCGNALTITRLTALTQGH